MVVFTETQVIYCQYFRKKRRMSAISVVTVFVPGDETGCHDTVNVCVANNSDTEVTVCYILVYVYETRNVQCTFNYDLLEEDVMKMFIRLDGSNK